MKNKRSLIINSSVILICILTFVFLCFNALDDINGWTALKELSETGYAIPIIYLVVLVALLLVGSVLGLLVDLNVIKGKKFAKVLNKGNFMLAAFLAFLYIVVVTQVLNMEFVKEILGWGSIVNIIIDMIAAVAVIVNCKLNEKAK